MGIILATFSYFVNINAAAAAKSFQSCPTLRGYGM